MTSQGKELGGGGSGQELLVGEHLPPWGPLQSALECSRVLFLLGAGSGHLCLDLVVFDYSFVNLVYDID